MKRDTAGRDRILETYAAVLMSIATVATAWCAYQSAEWGGDQAFLLGESQRAGRESDLHAALAAQKRNLDVAVFMEWVGGIATDNERLADFYAERFPPNLDVAVDAWLATDARQADENGDQFVLLTVVFASVLFFGGIEQRFTERKVRIGILVVGSLLFLGGAIAMLSYPVHLG